MLNLAARHRVEYRCHGITPGISFVLWDLARQTFGPGYRQEIRCGCALREAGADQISSSYARDNENRAYRGRLFGPLRNRSTAVLFARSFWIYFSCVRCRRSGAFRRHPGCMYGEMGRCLRPANWPWAWRSIGASGAGRGVPPVRGEVAYGTRVSGRRERLSEEWISEGAAMMHQRSGALKCAEPAG